MRIFQRTENREQKTEERKSVLCPLTSDFRHLSSGFTFVETMIVLALFGILGVALFSSFSLGMKVWKRSTAINVAERKAIIGLERLSMELRRAANDRVIGFYGEKDRVEFANIIADKILNISYAYAPQEKCLYRSGLSRQQILAQGELPAGRKVMVGVEDFSLSFFGYDNTTGNFSYLDAWNYSVSGIPSTVKVSVALEDGREFEKIVVIPIAQ